MDEVSRNDNLLKHLPDFMIISFLRKNFRKEIIASLIKRHQEIVSDNDEQQDSIPQSTTAIVQAKFSFRLFSNIINQNMIQPIKLLNSWQN